jgi:hypothetical protein
MTNEQKRAQEWLHRLVRPGRIPAEKVERELTQPPPIRESERAPGAHRSGTAPEVDERRLVDETGLSKSPQLGARKKQSRKR